MEVEHAGAARKGALSAWVRDVLVGVDPGHAPDVPEDALTGNEDAQLALWMTYELHYRGFDDVSPDAEWDLGILALRRQLERRFEEQLRAVTASAEVPLDTDVGEVLLDLAQSADGPSIALRLQRDATVDQMRDYLSQRSIVQLKESDPHSFVLGRLDGAAKVALAELQYDEYGGGRPGRLHAALYAQALRAAGLDPQYGAYIEQASAVTLASVNVMSMFAFNRRLRGASMGHLAIFEATSSLPCRRISRGLERLGFPRTSGPISTSTWRLMPSMNTWSLTTSVGAWSLRNLTCVTMSSSAHWCACTWTILWPATSFSGGTAICRWRRERTGGRQAVRRRTHARPGCRRRPRRSGQ